LSYRNKQEQDLSRISPTRRQQSNNGFEFLTGESSFTKILRVHCERDGKSRYSEVAAAAYLDPAYVYRLLTGEKSHPSPNTIIRLALALRLTVSQTDELLMAAGYAPLAQPKYLRRIADRASNLGILLTSSVEEKP
jgi:transcriptional regulator with XRE-family HTH domain